jgi:uncharacterized membrane protein YfcA
VPVDQATVLVMAILFVATVVRSAFGFGEAMVAVPLLVFVIRSEEAGPLAVLVSITVAGIIVAQDWRHVHFESAWRLVFYTLFGVPLGILMLLTVPESVVKLILALVILTFALYRFVTPNRWELKDDRLAWFFGFSAGVLGGAYGMNGPPLVVYGSLRRWPPERFRATLQGYFFPASLVTMGGYWMTGLWDPAVTRYYVLSLPVILVATLLGRFVIRRMSVRPFLLCVDALLVIVALLLLIQSWPGR